MGEVKRGKLFDLGRMWHTLFDPNVGATFLITLIFFLGFSCAIIYGFQPFTLNVLHITQTQNAILFTIFGAIGLIAQTFLVQRISKKLGMRRAFSSALVFVALAFVIMFFSRSLYIFVFAMIILSLVNSIVQTLIPAILSQEADAKSQGSIMGLNASYQSLGMIFGPIIGGLVATLFIPLPFIVGAALTVLCFFLSFRVLRPGIRPESAF